jgi:[ribosomal protein S5]-alanine N-acetyltransferase
MPTFLTERLVLRPFEVGDALTVETLVGDAEVARTSLIPHPYPHGAALEWIQGGYLATEEGRGYPLAMHKRQDNQLVGCMSLLVSPEHQRGTLAYWVGRPYWGQGYATEAARRMVEFGFSELRLHRIAASALHTNRASTRVMEKAGLQYEGTLREDLLHWGVFEDIDYYGLLQRDFLARARLF